jgi:5'(3')-deoxyribonucleotidase
MILGVDVDDTIADFTTEWVRRYNMKYGDNVTNDDVKGWTIGDYLTKATRNELFEILKEPDFYESVSPLRGARDGVYRLLAQGHRIVYVTSCVEGTMDQKRDWLVRWGFLSSANRFSDFIAAYDKALVNVDVLFDDRLSTVEDFPRDAVLINSPANVGYDTTRIRISGMKWAADALYKLKHGI